MELGTVYRNNKGLSFQIISKDKARSKGKHTYYNIRFLESGFEDSVRSDSIVRGLVRDYLSKSFCGVGMIGYADAKKNARAYNVWRDMNARCYWVRDKSYRYYGGAGVTVCERWHRFDLFLSDIEGIPGYNKDLFLSGLLRLDKDRKSNGLKIYSPNTTMWLSDTENQEQRTKEYNARNKKFAVFPDGHTERIENVTRFCKKNGLHRQNVNLCLAGKQSTTKGFRFYRERSKSTDYPTGEYDTQ